MSEKITAVEMEKQLAEIVIEKKAACEAARAEHRPLVCLGSLYMYADVKHAVLAWEESAR